MDFDAKLEDALEQSDEWIIEHYKSHSQEDFFHYVVKYWVGKIDYDYEKETSASRETSAA